MGNVDMGQAADTNCQASSRSRAVHVVGALIVLGLLLSPGCVRRRLNVRSNPPGALVYVDNQQIGTTPCSVDFIYYGTREIRLIKPGFETLTVNQPIPAPWYQIPPIDFVSENLVWTKIRDNRTVTYDMAPQLVVPTEQLIDRANQLRQDTLQFPVQAAAAISTGPVVVPAPTATVPGAFAPPPTTAVPLSAPPPSMGVPFPPPSMPPAGGSIVAPPRPTLQGLPQRGPPIVSPPLR